MYQNANRKRVAAQHSSTIKNIRHTTGRAPRHQIPQEPYGVLRRYEDGVWTCRKRAVGNGNTVAICNYCKDTTLTYTLPLNTKKHTEKKVDLADCKGCMGATRLPQQQSTIIDLFERLVSAHLKPIQERRLQKYSMAHRCSGWQRSYRSWTY